MMKNYNITVNNDKSINCDEEIHINFLENEVTTLTFQIPTELDDFVSVCVLETPNKKKKTLPLNNNILVISNEVSYAPGSWNLIFYCEKDEVVFVSDKLGFRVEKNYLDKEESENMDENIEILYINLLEKMEKLENLNLDDVENLSSDLQDIKNISSQILEVVQYNKTTLNSINSKTDTIANVLATVNTKIGDENSGVVHDAYWGLVRSEETKANTQTIINLLTDANAVADEILTELEG